MMIMIGHQNGFFFYSRILPPASPSFCNTLILSYSCFHSSLPFHISSYYSFFSFTIIIIFPPYFNYFSLSLNPFFTADHLTKFQIETIFYLFYSMPKDLLQACAAQELYRREWRYHGELRLWLKMRSQQELLQVQPNIIFLYFDVSGWEARLFVSQYRGNIASGLLTEEEVRVKAPTHSQVTVANPGAS